MTLSAKPARARRVRRKADRLQEKDAPVAAERVLSQRWRTAFIAKLAETSHVRSACEHAGVSATTVYDLRRRDPGFAAKWMEALCEGYDNLEMELLHRLRAGDGGDARYNYTVAMRMLQIHRETVTREKARRANVDAAAIRASIDRKVAEMRALVLADKMQDEREAAARRAGKGDADAG